MTNSNVTMDKLNTFICSDWDTVEKLIIELSPRCVIWDFDGVLFHSSSLFMNVLRGKLRDDKIHNVESRITDWEGLLGLNTHDLVWMLLKDKKEIDLNRFEKELIANYKKLANEKLSIDKESADVVRRQKELNALQCIVSNGYPDLIRKQILKANIADAISHIITPTKNLKPKPSTAMYEFLMDKIKIDKAYCVVIEDSDLGEITAKTAGLSVIKLTKP